MGEIVLYEPSSLLRKFLANFLRPYGFIVRAVDDAEAFLEAAEGSAVRLALVDCDGSLDVPALCASLRRRRPDLPLAFLAGKGQRGGALGADVPALSKPVSVLELVRLVQGLAAPSAPVPSATPAGGGAAEGAAGDPVPASERKGLRVLVVDDDPGYSTLVSSYLESRGYTVFVAHDGVEALEEVTRNPYLDTFVIDLNMPRLDGKGLIRELNRRINHPSILVMTGSTDEALKDYVVELGGAYAVLEKPFSLKTFARYFDGPSAT